MARKPARSKKDSTPSSTATLVNALRFVALAQKDIGDLNQTHVRLQNNWAVSFNGIVAMGHKIEEDLNACPHTLRLIDALVKCGDSLGITQLDTGRLSIRSGAFKALIPCTDPFTLAVALPDPPIAKIDDRLKDGLAIVGELASESATKVIAASVLVGPGMVTATDGHLMLQYWHGIDLPWFVLPKASIVALLKVGKPLANLGFSGLSVTFYFDDGSWLKSQLYETGWPNPDSVLDVKSNAWPVPNELFVAIEAVESFSTDGAVYFGKDIVKSHRADGVGATYDVTGVPADLAFSIKRIKLLKSIVKTIDLVGNGKVSYFFGDNLRGAITQMVD